MVSEKIRLLVIALHDIKGDYEYISVTSFCCMPFSRVFIILIKNL